MTFSWVRLGLNIRRPEFMSKLPKLPYQPMKRHLNIFIWMKLETTFYEDCYPDVPVEIFVRRRYSFKTHTNQKSYSVKVSHLIYITLRVEIYISTLPSFYKPYVVILNCIAVFLLDSTETILNILSYNVEKQGDVYLNLGLSCI